MILEVAYLRFIYFFLPLNHHEIKFCFNTEVNKIFDVVRCSEKWFVESERVIKQFVCHFVMCGAMKYAYFPSGRSLNITWMEGFHKPNILKENTLLH